MYQVSVKTNADLELTFFDSLVARVAHAGGLKVSVSEGRLVGAAGGAHHLAAGAAVVAAVDEAELRRAGVAHGHPGVGHPHRGRVPQLVVAVRRGERLQRHESRLPAAVVLDGAVEGVQPVVPLLDTPAMVQTSITVLL